MRFDVLTLFPAIVNGPLHESILKRAMDTGRLVVAVRNIRDYALDKHHVTDDVPYGGGGGMVMKPEPVFAAVQAALADTPSMRPPIILMTRRVAGSLRLWRANWHSTNAFCSSADVTRVWTSECASFWRRMKSLSAIMC